MASNLTVLAFDDMATAEQVHQDLVHAKNQGLIVIDDAAVVVKDEEGKVNVDNQVARGTWVSTDGWGYHKPSDGSMFYVIRYRGTGAHEGLTALSVMSQDSWGFTFDVEGFIIPGELPEAPEPPVEEALAFYEELASD